MAVGAKPYGHASPILYVIVFFGFVGRRGSKPWREIGVTVLTLPCAHAVSIAHPGGTGINAKTKRSSVVSVLISLISDTLLIE